MNTRRIACTGLIFSQESSHTNQRQASPWKRDGGVRGEGTSNSLFLLQVAHSSSGSRERKLQRRQDRTGSCTARCWSGVFLATPTIWSTRRSPTGTDASGTCRSADRYCFAWACRRDVILCCIAHATRPRRAPHATPLRQPRADVASIRPQATSSRASRSSQPAPGSWPMARVQSSRSRSARGRSTATLQLY